MTHAQTNFIDDWWPLWIVFMLRGDKSQFSSLLRQTTFDILDPCHSDSLPPCNTQQPCSIWVWKLLQLKHAWGIVPDLMGVSPLPHLPRSKAWTHQAPCLCHDGPYRPPHPEKGSGKVCRKTCTDRHRRDIPLRCYVTIRNVTVHDLHCTPLHTAIALPTQWEWPFQSDDWTGQNWRPSEPRMCWTMFAAILIGLPFVWVKITRELVTSWLKLAEICIKTYQVHDFLALEMMVDPRKSWVNPTLSTHHGFLLLQPRCDPP